MAGERYYSTAAEWIAAVDRKELEAGFWSLRARHRRALELHQQTLERLHSLERLVKAAGAFAESDRLK